MASAKETLRLMESNFSAWRQSSDWTMVADAFAHPRNENLLMVREGTGVIINGKRAKSPPLVSKEEFGDCRGHIEFLIPKGSNSGFYIQCRYEIQILDDYGDANTPYPGGECGGIYPRWDESRAIKSYDGHSPKVKASRPPGQWQSFDFIFRAAGFDSEGRKISNARILKMWQNGTLIHEDVELTGPTRGSMYADERAAGPILLQGDHGPVAFRNIKVTKIELDKMGLTNPFFAMDTGTIDEAHTSAKSQAEMLKELGYAGIGYWQMNPLQKMTGQEEMLAELDKCSLKEYSAYFTIKLEEPKEKYLPPIESSIQLLINRKTSIWLAITSGSFQKSSTQGDEQATAIIRTIADIAHQHGLSVALYPHADFWLETVDDAVRLAAKVNRRNVGVTFNLYHWLKTDRPENMNRAIEKASPYLFAVTINGTSEAGSIETLDKGTFEVYRFLKALKQNGYIGPIGLQGYGIGGDVRENLRKSMEAWRGFSRRLAAEQAEEL
jgi:sugar phosphate isomerase/epimerase